MAGTEEIGYFGPWGNVPSDGDLLPFTMINPVRCDRNRNNKKHHYISVTYMEGFADDRGRVWAYRSEDPANPHPVQPAAEGYRNYYYSQELPEGGQENHRFEDLWNSIETVWKDTIRAVKERRVSPAISLNLLGMATIMRARVPATRERHEVMIGTKMRAEVQIAEEFGLLPPGLERYAGQLDTVPIGVNPQQSLLAMRGEFKAFGDLCFRLGFEILHNRTNTPFITSDNPVCSYDPATPIPTRIPYQHDAEVELVFPIDAWTLLRGSNRLSPVNQVVRHRNLSDRLKVRGFNRTIAQFSYGLLIASDRSSDDLARRYANIVPTVTTEVRRKDKEVQIIVRDVFGPRPILPQYINTPEKAARLEKRMAEAAGPLLTDECASKPE